MEFKILRLFMKNKWLLTSRTTQHTTSKHKNYTIFPFILREIDADKTRLGRWNSKILRLFMKNKWWLTSRTTQNTTLKHKNCTIFPLILRERDDDKSVQDVGIQNFDVIYEEQEMAHIQYQKKHEFET
jgi:hypothetical protein